MTISDVREILEKHKLMSIGTYGKKYPDNSVVCFSYDENANLYFGSYSDTLKCKNISNNNIVAVTIGTLQIHGRAEIVEFGSEAYAIGRKNYDARFPQYREVFMKKNNELYIIIPYVIWNYNPSLGGEMYRECIVFNSAYLSEIDEYVPHSYEIRGNI